MTILFGSPEAKAIVDADHELKYERKTETETLECPECGGVIELVYETEEWEEDEKGNMKHSGFGPGVGFCENCTAIFCDSWDGLTVHRKAKK